MADASISKGFVVVKIDVDEMTGGQDVADRLRGSRGGGIPWMVVLDSGGNELISADSPSGNIGCPIEPTGATYFLTMLQTSGSRMNADDLATVASQLEEFSKPYRQ